MSRFPTNAARTLGLEIKVGLSGEEVFTRLDKLTARLIEQTAKLNALQGNFGLAQTGLLKEAERLANKPAFAAGTAGELEAKLTLGKIQLAEQAVLRQQQAALLERLRLQSTLQVRLGQELTTLKEIEEAQKEAGRASRLGMQLEQLKLDLYDRQAAAVRRVANAQTRAARGAIGQSQVLSAEGDNVGALSVVRAAQDQAPAGSRAALALRKEELAIIGRIRKEEKAAEDARLDALARQKRAIEENNRLQVRTALSNAKVSELQGDAPGALNILRNARGKIVDDQMALNRLLIEEQRIRDRIAASEVKFATQKAAEAAAQEKALMRRNSLEVRNAVAAGDFAKAVRAIDEAQTKVNRGSEADLNLQNRKLRVLQAQEAAVVNRALREANVLERRGDRAGAQALLTGVAGSIKDPDQALRISERQASIDKRINDEIASRGTLFSRVKGFMSDTLSETLRLLAAVFLIKRGFEFIGQTIYSAVFQPLVSLSKQVLTVTDQFRRLEITFAGIAGSLRASREIVRDIVLASEGLPVTPLQAVQAIRQTAFVPAIAERLNDPRGRQGFSEETLRTIVGLGTINPAQGSEGAGFAIREALAGQFRSLRFRFDISPDVVAASIGKRLEDLRRDPALTLRAISGFVNSFVGPEVFREMQNSLSTQGQRFKGLIERFFRGIGEVDIPGTGGFFDNVVTRIRGFNDAFSKFLTPQEGTADAAELQGVTQRVSLALQNFFDSILSLASGFLSALTGTSIDLKKAIEGNDFKQLGQIFASVIEGLSYAAVSVVGVLTQLAVGISGIADFLLPDPETTRRKLTAKALGFSTPPGSTQPTAEIFKRASLVEGTESARLIFEARAAVNLSDSERRTLKLFDLQKRVEAAGKSISDRVVAAAAEAAPVTAVAPPVAREAQPGVAQNVVDALTRGTPRQRPTFSPFLENAARQVEAVAPETPALQLAQFDKFAPGLDLNTALAEAAQRTRLRIQSLTNIINTLSENIKDDDATVPRTIAGGAESLRVAIASFAQGARNSIEDEANRARKIALRIEADLKATAGGGLVPGADASGTVFTRGAAQTSLLGNGLQTLIQEGKARVTSGITEAVQRQLDLINAETKDRSIADQVKELGAVTDDIFAIIEALTDNLAPGDDLQRVLTRAQALKDIRGGGTGLIDAFPPDLLQGQLQTVLAAGAPAAAEGILARAQNQNRLATLQAGGVEDVSVSVANMQKAVDELETLSAGIDFVAESIVRTKSNTTLGSIREAIAKAREAAAGELIALQRRFDDIGRSAGTAIEQARRTVEDAVFAGREKDIEAIDVEADRIAAKTALAIEKIGRDAIRQAKDIERSIPDLNREFGIFAPGVIVAKLKAVTDAANAAKDATKRAGGVELDNFNEAKIREVFDELGKVQSQFLTERERINREGTERILELEKQLGEARHPLVRAGLELLINAERRAWDERRRIADEGRLSLLRGPSQSRLAEGLLNSPLSATEGDPLANLERQFAIINQQRDGAIRSANIGTPGGLANQDAAARSIEQLRRLEAQVSDPAFIDALSLRGVDYTELLDKIQDAVAELEDQFGYAREAARETSQGISSAFQRGFSDSIVDAIKNGGNDIVNILDRLWEDILRSTTDMIVRVVLVEGVLNRLLNSLTGTNLATNNLFSGLFSTTSPSAGYGGAVGGIGAAGSGSLPSFGGAGAPAIAAQGAYVRAAEGAIVVERGGNGIPIVPVPAAEGIHSYRMYENVVPAAYGVLTRTNGLVPLADGRIARTVEDGTPEAIIPLRGGGVPVRQAHDGAYIPLPSAPGGRIPARIIPAANGAYTGPSMGRSVEPMMASAGGSWSGRNGDTVVNLATTIVNPLDSREVVRAAVAKDPNTIVNPVAASARGGGTIHRQIRKARR